jgi:hypothetical protein
MRVVFFIVKQIYLSVDDEDIPLQYCNPGRILLLNLFKFEYQRQKTNHSQQ